MFYVIKIMKEFKFDHYNNFSLL